MTKVPVGFNSGFALLIIIKKFPCYNMIAVTRKQKIFGFLFGVGLIFFLVLMLSFCSPSVPFEKLVQKEGLAYLDSQTKPFTGRAIQRFSNGNLKTETYYIRGKKHGKFQGWYSTGRQRFVNRFKDGLRDGSCIGWYENGQIKISTYFKGGEAQGKWFKYHRNGMKAEEESFIHDVRHGNRVQWYDRGEKKFQSFYKRGQYHGTVSSWYENGRKKFEKHFIDGIAHGIWRNWYSNGNPEIQLRFKNGKYDGPLIAWYKDGRNKWLRHAHEDRLKGTWKRWYENGTLKSKGFFKDGTLQGNWAEWHKNGSKKVEIQVQNGQRREIHQWYANGTKKLTAQWQARTNTWIWEYRYKEGVKAIDINKPILRGLYPHFIGSLHRSFGELTEYERQTLDSRRKIDDYPLYVMNYKGGYGLNSFLLKGIPDRGLGLSDLSLYSKEYRCSTFVTHNQNGQIIFAYNWDYIQCPLLILFTRPPHGYASVSMVDVLGMNRINENPHLGRLKTGTTFLGAPFYPLAGMNERGLALSCMYVPGEFVWNPVKVTLNMYHVIRVVLDYAADVNDAVELFRNYNNINSRSQHYLVADASGRSAIIEYRNGGVKVIPSRNPWQVATNSLVFGVSRKSLIQGCWRYKIADYTLKQQGGRLSWQEALELLKEISMIGTPETVSSIILNLNTGQIYLSMGRNYDEIKQFRLKNEISNK